MSKKTTDPLGHLAGPGAEAFRFWISLWPIAPMFGVEWRFQGMFPGMPGLPGAPAADPRGGRTRASAAPAAKAATAPATKAAAPAAAPEPRTTPAESPLAAAPRPAAKAEPQPAVKAEPQPAAKAEPQPAPKPAPKPAAAAPEPNVLPFGKAAEKPAPAHGNGVRAEAPEPEAEPVAGVRPASLLETAPGEADDLKMIKGIGPGLESQLNALGIYRFDQIAGFSEDELVWVNENLTSFKGRCFRDDWIGQAKDLLA